MSRRSLIVAWTGGAVFVASLLYVFYFYFVVLGRPVPPGDWLGPVAADALLFAVFAVHHSVTARLPVKRWLAHYVPMHLERTLFVWMSSLLLVLVCWLWVPVPGAIYRVGAPWSWLLVLVQIAGVALTVRASARLDVLELAGIRQVRDTRRERTPGMTGLQMSGPYTVVRHPVYLGWVALVFATPDMTANRLAFAVISTLYLVIATPLEERALEQAFGESYREYERKVRWRIVPWVY